MSKRSSKSTPEAWQQVSDLSLSSKNLAFGQKYFYPNQLFDETLINVLSKPIQNEPKKVDEQLSTDQNLEIKRCYEIWKKDEFEHKCADWNEIQMKLKKKNRENKEILKKFRNFDIPWYTSELKPRSRVHPNWFYNYPKISVKLPLKGVKCRHILKCIENQINVFWIDLRFGTRRMHEKLLESIKRALVLVKNFSPEEPLIGLGFKISNQTLMTGLVKHNRDVFLKRDSEVIVTTNRDYSHRCSHTVIYCNISSRLKRLKADQIIQIGSHIKLSIQKICQNSLKCLIIVEGLLTSKMDVILPNNEKLTDEPLAREVVDDILFAMNNNCDFIICSFALKTKLVNSFKEIVTSYQRPALILGNINTKFALENYDIEAVIENFHAFWLTGNISSEMDWLNDFVLKCATNKKLLVCDIKKLPSENWNFKNAEDKKITLLHPDCLAVSALENLDRTLVQQMIQKTYPQMNEDTFNLLSIRLKPLTNCVQQRLHRYIVVNAILNQATCIIIIDDFGETVFSVATKRPMIPIVAKFTDKKYARRFLLFKNVYPLVTNPIETPLRQNKVTQHILQGIRFAKSCDFILNSRPFVVCYSSGTNTRYCDTYRIMCL